MRPKSMILILIALTCGLVASIGISQVVEKKEVVEEVPSLETGPVYVAAVDVPIGEKLSAQTIKLEEWPLDRIPLGAISKFEDLDGRSPKQPLYAGEPILSAKLIDPNNPWGSAAQIPKGFRVMSVKVQMDTAVASLILPGDRVDVLVFLKRSAEISQTTTKTILTDVTVFAVDSKITRETTEDGTTLSAKTISVLVKPDQVERLTLAAELGRIRLSLRRSDEEGGSVTQGAGVDSLDETQSVRIATPTNPMMDVMTNDAFAGDGFVMQVITNQGVNKFTWGDDHTSLPSELVDGTAFGDDTSSQRDGLPPAASLPREPEVETKSNAEEVLDGVSPSRILLGPSSSQSLIN